jgi:hypothetical protein
MSKRISQRAASELMEILAAIEHERWSHWQRYMHGKCKREPDGSLTIPAALVTQWERQSSTPYSELSETERESDRDQVRRYLPVVMEGLDVVLEHSHDRKEPKPR